MISRLFRAALPAALVLAALTGGSLSAQEDGSSPILRRFPTTYHDVGPVSVTGGHMWCEFYLERYGWIPADVAVFGPVPCIGYASGRELGYYRGGGYEYALDGEKREIGSVQHPFESHGYEKAPPGEFSYRTEFHVTMLPGRSAYEGSKRNGVESGSWGAYGSSYRLSGD